MQNMVHKEVKIDYYYKNKNNYNLLKNTYLTKLILMFF